MPYPVPPDWEDQVAAGRFITADLVDLYCADGVGDPLTLRWWNWPGTIDYAANDDPDGDGDLSADPVTYTCMYGRLLVQKALRQSASLSSEALRLTLDASRSGDDEDQVGIFVDADWHQRPVRVRQILLDTVDGTTPTDVVWEWHGLLDHRQNSVKNNQSNVWEVTCQGGLFRVRGRRLKTRSPEDQQRRAPGDRFYDGTAKMVGRPLVWGKQPTTGPGTKPGIIDIARGRFGLPLLPR